eukprot:TRINITY_DN47808_c0_g1_i1.p1 TRINITY_DN47808_c0_g1~~TRINITY_DN47808_c0_g1_i1.p1  ORF type:complete len:351 (+),score=117.20 TRINITY_DN47808_c0_g1_i1:60-1055(+)
MEGDGGARVKRYRPDPQPTPPPVAAVVSLVPNPDEPPEVAKRRGTARRLPPPKPAWLHLLPDRVAAAVEANLQDANGEPVVGSDVNWCELYLQPEVVHSLPNGPTLTVTQAPVETMHHVEKNATHGHVWRSSVVMAKYLLTQPPPPAGTRMVEVGGGCGLPSMAAAYVGYSATVTDRPGCLEQAFMATMDPRNTPQWDGKGSVDVTEMDWRLRHTYCEPARLVVGCDVAYAPLNHLALLECLASVVHPEGRALIATQVRYPLRELPFWALARKLFKVEDVGMAQVDLSQPERDFIYVRELRPLPEEKRSLRFGGELECVEGGACEDAPEPP